MGTAAENKTMLSVGMCAFLFVFVTFCVLGANGVRLGVLARASPVRANQMSLRGSGCALGSWQTAHWLVPIDSNSFFISFDCTAGEQIAFKLLRDDSAWQHGANVVVNVPNSNVNVTITPGFDSQNGAYSVLPKLFSSTALGNSRQAVLYVPPVVLDNNYAKVPLLIMHDGQNVFNASTAAFGVSWDASETLDFLIAQGSMSQIAILALYNTPDRIDDYTYVYDSTVPGGGKADLYLDLIEQEVLPFVEKELPFALIDRSNLGMLGSSLGGLLSCYAGYTRSIYGKLGCMSSSFWWDNNNFNNSIIGSGSLPSSDTIFYVDSGDMEANGCKPPSNCDDRLQTIDVRDHLKKLGWKLNSNLFYFLAHGGVHNERSWGDRFFKPMIDLYPPQILSP